MSVRFVSTIPPAADRPDLPPIEGAMPARDRAASLSPEKVRAALAAAIKEVTSLLDACATTAGVYTLDEVEVSLNMNQSGEVNIIVGKLQGEASEGLRLKWKRRDGSQQSPAPYSSPAAGSESGEA